MLHDEGRGCSDTIYIFEECPCHKNTGVGIIQIHLKARHFYSAFIQVLAKLQVKVNLIRGPLQTTQALVGYNFRHIVLASIQHNGHNSETIVVLVSLKEG